MPSGWPRICPWRYAWMRLRTHYEHNFFLFVRCISYVAFLCAPPPPPCKIREANQRSMCTQYSPNLSSNHRHASFAPTLSEIPTILGTLYIARVVIRAVSEFFFLPRGTRSHLLVDKVNERDLMHFSIARVAARFAYPFEIENHFRENLPF